MRCPLCGRPAARPDGVLCRACEELDEAWEVRVVNIAAVAVGLLLFGLAMVAWSTGIF